jgi:hypothetical protein
MYATIRRTGAGKIMSEPHEEHWLTYAELGQLLGCTANAARVRAQRHGWPRRAPNIVGGRAVVLVPEEVAVRGRATHIEAMCDEHPTKDVRDPDDAVRPHVQALMQAVNSLTEQLAIANRRVDQAEERAANKDRVIEHLREEIRFLVRHLTDRRPWWRRWFW